MTAPHRFALRSLVTIATCTISISIVAFLLGRLYGINSTERDLDAFIRVLGHDALHGDGAAAKACDGLIGKKELLNVSPTAHYLYDMLHIYYQRDLLGAMLPAAADHAPSQLAPAGDGRPPVQP